MGTEVKHKCFVIMPFSKTSERHTEEHWTKHFEDFIKPLIESTHPLIAKRSSPLRGDILRTIITDLVTAPIVVADLTDSNPNVYWELGVRQSFKHCTITIAEYGTTLPFDLGAKGTLFYFPTDYIKMQAFKDQFHEAINDCLKNPTSPDSHVLETISGRGTLYQILVRDELVRKLDALIHEIKHNEFIFQHAMKTCQENAEKREKKKKGEEVVITYPTGHLRAVAVEALVVNRYINAKIDFYEAAEDYMDDLNRVNVKLIDWPNRPGAIEPWLLKSNDYFKPCMEKFKKQTIEHKKAIETIL